MKIKTLGTIKNFLNNFFVNVFIISGVRYEKK